MLSKSINAKEARDIATVTSLEHSSKPTGMKRCTTVWMNHCTTIWMNHWMGHSDLLTYFGARSGVLKSTPMIPMWQAR